MLLAVLILTSIFNDIQADVNRTVAPFLHEIHKRSFSDDCRTIKECWNQRQELESCKICGLLSGKGPSETIINGQPVHPPNLYPWMVALREGKARLCGGVILSNTFILTAAHCVLEKGDNTPFKSEGETSFRDPSELNIGFLTKFIDLQDGPPIERIIPHPGFQTSHMRHDIALIKLKGRIKCDENKNPICLPPANFNLPRREALRITGWGAVAAEPRTKYPKELKEGRVRAVNFRYCAQKLPNHLQNHVYCFIGLKNQRSCFGDSGGPAFIDYENRFFAIGVASMQTSETCGRGEPFAYTSIVKNLKWIKRVTGLSPRAQGSKVTDQEESDEQSSELATRRKHFKNC